MWRYLMIREEKNKSDNNSMSLLQESGVSASLQNKKIIIKSFSSETFIRLKEAECCATERDKAAQAIRTITKASFRMRWSTTVHIY